MYIDCSSILANKDLILSQVLHNKIKSINNPLYVKNISIITYFSKNFIYYVFFNFFKIDYNNKLVLAKIRKKIYLVEELKAKMLIDNNILVIKGFILDLLNKEVTIFSCNTKIQILIQFQGWFILKKVLAIRNIIILP